MQYSFFQARSNSYGFYLFFFFFWVPYNFTFLFILFFWPQVFLLTALLFWPYPSDEKLNPIFKLSRGSMFSTGCNQKADPGKHIQVRPLCKLWRPFEMWQDSRGMVTFTGPNLLYTLHAWARVVFKQYIGRYIIKGGRPPMLRLAFCYKLTNCWVKNVR